MNTIFVGYDLNKTGQDYSKLVKRLKEYGTWWHHLDSTWLIKTEQTAVEVRNVLAKLIDANDELLVMGVTGRSAAWRGFSEKGSDWLKKNL